VIRGVDHGLEGFEHRLTVGASRRVREAVFCLMLYAATGGNIKV
jgi:hypothetical protein